MKICHCFVLLGSKVSILIIIAMCIIIIPLYKNNTLKGIHNLSKCTWLSVRCFLTHSSHILSLLAKKLIHVKCTFFDLEEHTDLIHVPYCSHSILIYTILICAAHVSTAQAILN